MISKKILAIIVTCLILTNVMAAEDEHDHDEHISNASDLKIDNHKKEIADKNKDHDDADKDGESHDDHDDEKVIEKGKAIIEVDEKKGFRLSKEAIKTLKLKLDAVDSASFNISNQTLVSSKNEKGVYRFRAGFFKLLHAKIIKETPLGYIVEVKEVAFGDQIVTGGVDLLRVADVYSIDKSDYGHSH